MINSKTIKFNLFFSFALVLMLFFSTASAVFSENFDDDTVNNNPSAFWYTYWENPSSSGRVSNDYNVSDPNSFKMICPDGDTISTKFTIIPYGYELEYLNFSLLLNETGVTALGNIICMDDDDDPLFDFYIDCNTLYDSATSNIVATMELEVWTNVSVCFNWTDGTYRLSADNGSGWISDIWSSFLFGNGDEVSLLSFAGSALFGDNLIFYVDNLLLVYSVMPEAVLASPVNNSVCNPVTADFSIHEWDNDTLGFINSTVYLYIWDGITWSYVAEYNNDSIASGDYHDGSFDNPNVSLCLNRTYRWNATLVSDGDTVYTGYNYFLTGCNPMNMTIWGYNETSDEHDDINETDSISVLLELDAPYADEMSFSNDGITFTDDYPYAQFLNYTLPCEGNGYYTVYARFLDDCGYFYCNDTIYLNGSLPNLTLLYPEEDETYLDYEWGEFHNAIFDGMMDESYNFAINVTCDWYTMTDDDCVYDLEDATLDLSPYVFFDDTSYNITFNVSNCFGSQTLMVNFTIGDPDDSLGKHISLKALSPERENYSQISLLEQGVMFDIISTEIDGIWYRYFITDWNGNVLDENFDYAKLDNKSGWQTKNYFKQRLYSRSFYKVWIGITDNDTQFDDLYGYESIQYTSFMDMPFFFYLFNNSFNATQNMYTGRYQLIDGYDGMNISIIYDVNVSIYDNLTGVMWGFGTYKIGDIIPFHSIGGSLYDFPGVYESNWGREKFDSYFPGLSIFVALMVILGFAVFPIVITRTFPPVTVELLFIQIGAVVAYAMGLFDLWVFELMLVAILMALFYKIFRWYQSSQGATMMSDAPVKSLIAKPTRGAWERLKKAETFIKSRRGKE